MLIDPPTTHWYRADEEPLGVPTTGRALAVQTRSRDAATAQALRAYLASRPVPSVRTTVDLGL